MGGGGVTEKSGPVCTGGGVTYLFVEEDAGGDDVVVGSGCGAAARLRGLPPHTGQSHDVIHTRHPPAAAAAQGRHAGRGVTRGGQAGDEQERQSHSRSRLVATVVHQSGGCRHNTTHTPLISRSQQKRQTSPLSPYLRLKKSKSTSKCQSNSTPKNFKVSQCRKN